MKQATLDQLLADRAAKRAVVLATNLTSGDERLIYPAESNGLDAALADFLLGVGVVSAFQEASDSKTGVSDESATDGLACEAPWSESGGCAGGLR